MIETLGKAFKAVFCACFIALLPLPAHSAQINDTLHAGMAQALREEGLNGAVWSTVSPVQGIQLGAAGTRNAADGTPMMASTRVQVGSVAKTVLAMGVLRLVATGQLSLDTDVARLLPTLAIDNPWAATHPLHVRHLLAHTAGLENFRFSQVFSLQAQPDMPLSAALERTPGILTVLRRPGTRYAYSNTSYHLLGMVIEAATGMRYERYLDKELIEPLGMRDSGFGFVTQVGFHTDPSLAMGHFEGNKTQQALPIFLRPATQFTTTASDMARLAVFLMGKGDIDGRPFIAAQLMAALIPPQDTDATRAGLQIGHGLALAVRDRHGSVGGCHPGTTIGFRAMFCLYPDEGKAFFVAFNTDSETADYERFNRALMAALGLTRPIPPSSAAAGIDLAAWEGVYVPMWSAVRSFAWADTVFNAVELKRDGDCLLLDPMQGKKSCLRQAGGQLLRAEGRVQPSHALFDNPDGKRVLSDGLHDYEKTERSRMILLWTSAALGLAGLAYVLFKGLWQLVKRRLRVRSALALPFIAVAALLLPAPFFATQPFLQMGDATPASVLLACLTALLPLAMLAGLVQAWRAGRQALADGAALAATLQWLLVLAAWEAIPVVLWR